MNKETLLDERSDLKNSINLLNSISSKETHRNVKSTIENTIIAFKNRINEIDKILKI